MKSIAIIVTVCMLALIAAGKEEIMLGPSYGYPYSSPPYAAPPYAYPYGSMQYPSYGSRNGQFYR